MNKITSPCKGCENRYLGCHSKCEDYAKFKQYRERINQNRKSEAKVLSFKIDATINTNNKIK